MAEDQHIAVILWQSREDVGQEHIQLAPRGLLAGGRSRLGQQRAEPLRGLCEFRFERDLMRDVSFGRAAIAANFVRQREFSNGFTRCA